MKLVLFCISLGLCCSAEATVDVTVVDPVVVDPVEGECESGHSCGEPPFCLKRWTCPIGAMPKVPEECYVVSECENANAVCCDPRKD